MDYRTFQSEHRAWLDRAYPNQPLEVPAAGMVEEAGELLHAVLKLQQKIIWGDEPRQGDLRAKFVDAVGDCAIYVCSFCNAAGWEFEHFASQAKSTWSGDTLQLSVRLVRVAADNALLMSASGVVDYISTLKQIACANEIGFDEAIASAWKAVSTR